MKKTDNRGQIMHQLVYRDYPLVAYNFRIYLKDDLFLNPHRLYTNFILHLRDIN